MRPFWHEIGNFNKRPAVGPVLNEQNHAVFAGLEKARFFRNGRFCWVERSGPLVDCHEWPIVIQRDLGFRPELTESPPRYIPQTIDITRLVRRRLPSVARSIAAINDCSFLASIAIIDSRSEWK